MPNQIQKSLQDCLSKIKVSHKQMQLPLRSCKHPKTPSFSVAATAGGGKNKGSDAATLSDIDKFLFENFRSLYQKEFEEETSKKTDRGGGGVGSGKTAAFLLESPRLLDFPPPENLCRSARFFVAAGSSSSLIMEEPAAACSSSSASTGTSDSSPTEEEAEDINKGNESPRPAAPDDFIALLTYSPSPYEDFRRSMLEMVEARVEHNGKVDWEFLEELLFCYLDLNNKKAYRFILRAFVDLIVVLRENAGRIPAIRPPLNGGRRRRQLK